MPGTEKKYHWWMALCMDNKSNNYHLLNFCHIRFQSNFLNELGRKLELELEGTSTGFQAVGRQAGTWSPEPYFLGE